MIRVSGIRVPLDFDFSRLDELCTKKLGIDRASLKSVKLHKKSVDARKKADVHFIISLDIRAKGEKMLLKRLKNAVPAEKFHYIIPKVSGITERPVIVGFGPAGMFAALVLAESGTRPIVLERGKDVDSRCAAVEEFRKNRKLDTECNVQFGEGGAGTFSDGKLTTGIKDKRIEWILERLVEFGAPEEILYLAKPHIGTDRLRHAVKKLRERVIALGGDVRFGAKFCGFTTDSGCIDSVSYSDSDGIHSIDTHNVILAAGHSARDVFRLLKQENIMLAQKSFAVGMRIEHDRRQIDRAMYGDFADHPALKAADYKLAVHLPGGRTLYTFCMCPGGYVIAAASEKEGIAVNGMSCFARDGKNSNSALLVNVEPDDLGSSDPLAGVFFQRDIEHKAFIAGGADYSAPVITVGDLLNEREPVMPEDILPTYSPGIRPARPETYLPDFVCDAVKSGIREMGKKIPGFDSDSAVLTGVESRSSSPVRICRGEDMQSISVKGLFPCGEGAGYAGGIISAAVDGIKCAEMITANTNFALKPDDLCEDHAQFSE